VMKANR